MMINLRSNTCVHSYTLSSVASSIVSSGWLSPYGRLLWVLFNCWLEERSADRVLQGTRILAERSQYTPGFMQTPSAGVTPDSQRPRRSPLSAVAEANQQMGITPSVGESLGVQLDWLLAIISS